MEQKVKKLLIFVSIVMPLFLCAGGVVINEVVSSNSASIFDEDGDASDWIELYNDSTASISLESFYLSDDPDEITKWQFGSAVIGPGQYLIVFASDKNKFDTYWHTNFKISASGENIILSDSDGLIVDSVFVPDSETDVSYGRTSDGALSWVFQAPSPGLANTGQMLLELAEPVTVSVPGGFYASAVTVELTPDLGEIRYTLDGSDPDSSSALYTAPFAISETAVLKAIRYQDNRRPSLVTYMTYLIGVDTDLPVISLITDPYNLFDYNYGIYADGPGWTPNPPHHGANYWMDWERPAHVQFFDDQKSLGFSEDCGIEIYGAYTRSFPQKSFTVKFKDPYNPSSLEYPLFPDFELTTFKSFILRNSGNDFQYTHIRDAMMQSLIRDLDIDYLEYRPAAAYLNGEYWGIYNIREKINEHYVANRHGVDPDNIDMLEGNMQVIHGDSQHYTELINYISTNDMSTDEAYDYIDSMIDIDNCLLYFAAEVYYNSQDWPANNIKYWRERSATGKWRWIIFDLDFGFNLYETNGQSEDHLYYLLSGIETRPGSNPPWSTLLPRKLMENPRIRNQFINLIADLLNTNFKSERVVARINEMADHIANEGLKHRERWEISQYTFDDHLQRMRTFANERPGYVRGFVENFFNCGNNGTITVNATKGGKVRLNSLELDSTDFSWSGTYFTGNSVNLTALAEAGYRFDGWSGAETSAEESIKLNVSSSTSLFASFSPDSTAGKRIVINEINYNAAEEFDPGDWIELYNNSDQTIDLSNWYYSDSDPDHQFFLPAGTMLEPGDYLVLVENASAFSALFPDVENYLGDTDFGLSGSGEFMKLVNSIDEIEDSLTYDDNAPWPTEPDGNGPTLELVDANSDNSLGESWRASAGHGTPGKVNSVTDVRIQVKNSTQPGLFDLSQNFPNPFNPTTSIQYSLPAKGFISLKVFDLTGKEVMTLYEGNSAAGRFTATFDGRELSSGIYFYVLRAGQAVQTKKMILLR